MSADAPILPNLAMDDVPLSLSSVTCAGAWPHPSPPHLQAQHLAGLIERERLTYARGVPTIWADLLRFADEAGMACPSLPRRVAAE